MRALVAGGGPVGVFTAIGLARRGHDVTVVDRDPGPAADGSWHRTGVMQFEHAHGWRPQVVTALEAEMPGLVDELVSSGAGLHHPPGIPDLQGLSCRRSVVEAAMRRTAGRTERLTWVTGHVDQVEVTDGTATGLVVDGQRLAGDLVVIATGRAGRLGDELRGSTEGGPCGFAYVIRHYRARIGQPAYAGLPSFQTGPGYVSVVIGQDNETHVAVIAYPSDGEAFGSLRTAPGHERACRLIPNLAPWTDPDRFEPISDVLVGGNLTNTYRLQGPAPGLPPATGLYFVGDTVLTTNPAAGRNLALLMPHAQQLLATLDDPDRDLDDASLALDTWAEQHLRPWFLDHVRWDRTLLERFAGADIDLADRIPSDVVCAAVQVDPSLMPYVGMYLGMVAGPDVLDPVEGRVRELLETGWRPATPGPTGAELARATAVEAARVE